MKELPVKKCFSTLIKNERNEMKKIFLLFIIVTSLFAQAFSDNAANYGGDWTSGSNGGTGFLAWFISSNNNDFDLLAGGFLGSSTDGAGNINTGGVSFGLYASPSGAFVNADRPFSEPLPSGSTLTFQLGVNFDNGNKGFNIYAGTQGEVFNFNVGNGGSVSSANATLTPGSGSGYNYGGNDAVIDISIDVQSASSFTYTITRSSSQGNQGTLLSGTVSDLTELLTGIRFYNSGTEDDQPGNNLYINSLTGTNTALPVELTFFTGELIDATVDLNWQTATETNNYGFNVECKTENVEWETKGFVWGHGTTNSPKNYKFTDSELPNSETVSYRLKQIDNDGTSTYSKTVTVDLKTITSVEDEMQYGYALEQNYPNPFNPITTIKFTVPSIGTSPDLLLQTSLIVYDVLGRKINTLLNQKLQPGNHEVKFDASNLSSGIYFYGISVDDKFNSIKKMLLIK